MASTMGRPHCTGSDTFRSSSVAAYIARLKKRRLRQARAGRRVLNSDTGRLESLDLHPVDSDLSPRHGTGVGYREWACRCLPCTRAASGTGPVPCCVPCLLTFRVPGPLGRLLDGFVLVAVLGSAVPALLLVASVSGWRDLLLDLVTRAASIVAAATLVAGVLSLGLPAAPVDDATIPHQWEATPL